MEISRDPIINIIYKGLKEPIVLCMNNNAERAALILLYAAIDSLTKLGLPEHREKATRKDYAEWCEMYLIFNTEEKISGLEWYAARCGLLHSYASESDLSDEGKVRIIGYYIGTGEDIIFRPQINKNILLVRIEGLIDAFYRALDKFIVDLYAFKNKEIINKRFNKMLHLLALDHEKE